MRFSPVAKVTFSNVWAIVFLRALDLFWATLIWRQYDITISSWTGLACRQAYPPIWARDLEWALNHIQPNHCEKAIRADIERANSALKILGAS